MPWLLATYTVLGVILAILFIKDTRAPWYVKLIGAVIALVLGPVLALITGAMTILDNTR